METNRPQHFNQDIEHEFEQILGKPNLSLPTVNIMQIQHPAYLK